MTVSVEELAKQAQDADFMGIAHAEAESEAVSNDYQQELSEDLMLDSFLEENPDEL
jgi:hypothetical protein